MAGDVVRNYRIRYSAEDKASPTIAKVGASALEGAKSADVFSAKLRALNDSLAWTGQGATVTADFIKELNAAFNGLPKDVKGKLDAISSGLGRVDFNAGTATRSIGGLGQALGTVTSHVGGFNTLQAAVQKTQRSTYGLMKNAEGAAGAMGQIAATASGLQAAAIATADLGKNLKTTGKESATAETAFGSMFARLMAWQAANAVIDSIGDSIRKAREDTIGWAEDALKLRDELRELANLKGKPGADDGVVADQLRFRVETGMTAPEARKFQEQFLGSLPLAKDAGGIDDKTAGDLAGQIGRLSVRTGLDGGTAGDLAGVMGMFGKIPDAQVGLGQAQQIVDQLNDGRGNLTPLTKALLKGAASTVGKGKAFGSLAERAAAISVASGIGDKNSTDMNVGAAIRALSPGGTVAKVKTLKDLGIGGNQDFLERIDRLAPLFEGAKAKGQSANDALVEAGFGNIQDRRALIGFFENREVLRKRIGQVRETNPNDPHEKARAAARRSSRLNDQFFETDKAARNRVANAKLEAAKLKRGMEGEDLQIARREAEAKLIEEGKLDTPWSNFQDAARGLFGLQEKFGGQSGREERIDEEVIRRANEEAVKRGLKPGFSLVVGARKGAKEAAEFLRKSKEEDAKKVKPGNVAVPGDGKQKAAANFVNPLIDADGGAGGGAVGGGPDPGGGAKGLNGGGALDKLSEIARILKMIHDSRPVGSLPSGRNVQPERP